jgi:hypothetical protein
MSFNGVALQNTLAGPSLRKHFQLVCCAVIGDAYLNFLRVAPHVVFPARYFPCKLLIISNLSLFSMLISYFHFFPTPLSVEISGIYGGTIKSLWKFKSFQHIPIVKSRTDIDFE